MTSSICSSCKRTIRWAKTEGGKAIPLDPERRPHGNLMVVGLDRDGKTSIVRYVKRSPESRYVPHFSSCPNAAQHRKGKSGKDARKAEQRAARELELYAEAMKGTV